MNVFYMSKIKKLCLISNIITFIAGLIFGFIYYNMSNDIIRSLLNQLFTNNTNYYIISGIIFIFINTYLSSSYVGFIGSGFIVFLKAIQISYSLIYINEKSEFTIFIFLILTLKIILEIFFVLSSTIQFQELSCYIYYILYNNNKKISLRSTLNNQLNIVIYCLLILFICIFIKNL